MFCTACSSHNPATLLRCTNCGELLRHETTSGSTTRSHRRRSRGRTHHVRLFLALVPLLVVTIAGGVSIRTYRSEQAVLAAAYERAELALDSGDYSSAIAAY